MIDIKEHLGKQKLDRKYWREVAEGCLADYKAGIGEGVEPVAAEVNELFIKAFSTGMYGGSMLTPLKVRLEVGEGDGVEEVYVDGL